MALSKLGNIKIAALLVSFCMVDESISSWTPFPYTNSAFQPWYQSYQHFFERPANIQSIEAILAPELLDIALLASVDGNVHARNRTSGEALWTLSPSPESDDLDLLATALSPLIRIERDANETVVDADSPRIAYALESQSGVIYELSVSDNGTTTPSRRLIRSVPELARLSPILIYAGDRVLTFIGKKEVRVLVIDLETGYLEDVVDANSSIEFTGRTGSERRYRSLEGDLEGDASASTIVLLERTDYELTIITKDSLSIPSRTSHKLHFSTYGSYVADSAIQADYRRPSDDMYIQSLPNGETMSFQLPISGDSSQYTSAKHLWVGSAGTPSDSPIVAVFDLFGSSIRERPLALLQPIPPMRELFPQIDAEFIARSTFFGRTEDGSQFAMSPEHFPLVAFHNGNIS